MIYDRRDGLDNRFSQVADREATVLHWLCRQSSSVDSLDHFVDGGYVNGLFCHSLYLFFCCVTMVFRTCRVGKAKFPCPVSGSQTGR